MTTTDRLVRLQRLRAELATLLTPSERHSYHDPIENLGDLIADLQLEETPLSLTSAPSGSDPRRFGGGRSHRRRERLGRHG